MTTRHRNSGAKSYPKKVYTLSNITEIYGRHVRVYFNLHKKTWSIKDKKSNRVIGWADFIPMKDCKFIVSEAGRQRVLREKKKNVHAYVDGIIGGGYFDKCEVYHHMFTYNPYKYETFVIITGGEPRPVYGADMVYLECRNKKPSQRMINWIKL